MGKTGLSPSGERETLKSLFVAMTLLKLLLDTGIKAIKSILASPNPLFGTIMLFKQHLIRLHIGWKACRSSNLYLVTENSSLRLVLPLFLSNSMMLPFTIWTGKPYQHCLCSTLILWSMELIHLLWEPSGRIFVKLIAIALLPLSIITVTGPLKNAIDWAWRPVMFGLIKLLLLLVLLGDFGGGLAQFQLCQIGFCLDFHFINKPEFSLKAFRPPAEFDSEGEGNNQSRKGYCKFFLP